MDDYLVELSAEGEELQRISVLECLESGGADDGASLHRQSSP